jgi:hypothetical protein
MTEAQPTTAPTSRTHALNRTSPKGGPFVGTCFQCGKTGLPIGAVTQPCENVANLTGDEALMVAIQGDAQTSPPKAL